MNLRNNSDTEASGVSLDCVCVFWKNRSSRNVLLRKAEIARRRRWKKIRNPRDADAAAAIFILPSSFREMFSPLKLFSGWEAFLSVSFCFFLFLRALYFLHHSKKFTTRRLSFPSVCSTRTALFIHACPNSVAQFLSQYFTVLAAVLILQTKFWLCLRFSHSTQTCLGLLWKIVQKI